MEHRKITDDDIAALKEGKCLYCDNGEYAQIISYAEQLYKKLTGQNVIVKIESEENDD